MYFVYAYFGIGGVFSKSLEFLLPFHCSEVFQTSKRKPLLGSLECVFVCVCFWANNIKIISLDPHDFFFCGGGVLF